MSDRAAAFDRVSLDRGQEKASHDPDSLVRLGNVQIGPEGSGRASKTVSLASTPARSRAR